MSLQDRGERWWDTESLVDGAVQQTSRVGLDAPGPLVRVVDNVCSGGVQPPHPRLMQPVRTPSAVPLCH